MHLGSQKLYPCLNTISEHKANVCIRVETTPNDDVPPPPAELLYNHGTTSWYCTIGKNRYLERVQPPFNHVAALLGLMCISTIDREIAVAVDELLDQYPTYIGTYKFKRTYVGKG